jgi:hypothetical protein
MQQEEIELLYREIQNGDDNIKTVEHNIALLRYKMNRK